MCGSRGDDPSMHDVDPDQNVWDYLDRVQHNHPDFEHFVSGCPKCEADTASAEASDHSRERNL